MTKLINGQTTIELNNTKDEHTIDQVKALATNMTNNLLRLKLKNMLLKKSDVWNLGLVNEFGKTEMVEVRFKNFRIRFPKNSPYEDFCTFHEDALGGAEISISTAEKLARI